MDVLQLKRTICKERGHSEELVDKRFRDPWRIEVVDLYDTRLPWKRHSN
jgi:hypothetical protein